MTLPTLITGNPKKAWAKRATLIKGQLTKTERKGKSKETERFSSYEGEETSRVNRNRSRTEYDQK